MPVKHLQFISFYPIFCDCNKYLTIIVILLYFFWSNISIITVLSTYIDRGKTSKTFQKKVCCHIR